VYYSTLLKQNGWTEGQDFAVAGGVLHFFGVTKLDGGTKGPVGHGGATDNKRIPYDPIRKLAVASRRRARVERSATRQDGLCTLIAFGIVWNSVEEDVTITTSTSTVAAHFSADDSAEQVIAKIKNACVDAGWDVTLDAAGDLVLTATAGGVGIFSLWWEVDYFESEGHTENDDHWAFEVIEDD
jgi:hypothetical protein